MIDVVRGRLLRKSPAEVIVDVGGVGLAVAVPLTVYERLGEVGDSVTLLTHLYVRDDALQLYGFTDEEQRRLFLRLIGVSGVGPRMALAILSRFTPDELATVVTSGDARLLTAVRGIGRKTAERLMVELKDRVAAVAKEMAVVGGGERSTVREAVRALETLGSSPTQAYEAVRRAMKKLGDDAPVEELVRQALKG